MYAIHRVVITVAFALTAILCCTAQTTPRTTWGCLRGVVAGGNDRPVMPCTPGDPLGLSDSGQIDVAMSFLEIPRDSVRFNGCEEGFYAAGEDPLRAGGYLITYPAGEKRFLAPVTHELAHVMQMRLAGGLGPFVLQQDSLHAELGADFVAGIVFTAKFANLDRGEFQNNIQLVGRYDERAAEAHGSPSQRTAAFRYGLNFRFREDVSDVRMAVSYFKDVLYDEVRKM